MSTRQRLLCSLLLIGLSLNLNGQLRALPGDSMAIVVPHQPCVRLFVSTNPLGGGVFINEAMTVEVVGPQGTLHYSMVEPGFLGGLYVPNAFEASPQTPVEVNISGWLRDDQGNRQFYCGSAAQTVEYGFDEDALCLYLVNVDIELRLCSGVQ